MQDNLCAKIDTVGDASQFLQYIASAGIWSINPYRHCQHRCIYCIARSQGESTPWHAPGAVIPVLRSALQQIPYDAEIFIGSLVDAYPPLERGLGITRLILRELVYQQRPFCINTKSDLVTRDIDLLDEHNGHCDVCLSLCSLDDDALWVLEPGAPSSLERLDAIRVLHQSDIEVIIDASPWIPGISNARELIAQRPDNVPVHFAPLDLRCLGGQITLLGRKYTQEEIDTAYCAERDALGEIDGVLWKETVLV